MTKQTAGTLLLWKFAGKKKSLQALTRSTLVRYLQLQGYKPKVKEVEFRLLGQGLQSLDSEISGQGKLVPGLNRSRTRKQILPLLQL